MIRRVPRAYRLIDEAGQVVAELLEAGGLWYAYGRGRASSALGPYDSEDEAADAVETAWRLRGSPRQVLHLQRSAGAGGGL